MQTCPDPLYRGLFEKRLKYTLPVHHGGAGVDLFGARCWCVLH